MNEDGSAMYYFVVCEHRSRGSDAPALLKSNIILHDIHPLVWAAHPPAAYDNAFTLSLLFWSEIPESIALDPGVRAYFSSGGVGEE
jgi:hypothetical protein